MNEADYHGGWKNALKNGYFYLLKGLDELKRWQTLGLFIIGVCAVAKITSIWMMGLFFLISIPILIVIGFIVIHHVASRMDFLGTKFGSHFAIKTFDYTKSQFETTKNIEQLLIDIKNK